MSETIPHLPLRARVAMLLRLLAVQASWNYETMAGNGIAFAMEPALRLLPGGRNGERYRAAMARQSGYFNSHPYLAGLAVGGLARAEIDGDTDSRILRFRSACCGPLGSVGDQVVWTGWLPFCSLVSLFMYSLGAGPGTVVAVFMILFNAGHLGLRAWALEAGWRQGLKIANFLAHPVFRRGPGALARANAALAGVTVPLLLGRLFVATPSMLGIALLVGVGWALVTIFVLQRAGGWRAALAGVAAFVLYSVLS